MTNPRTPIWVLQGVLFAVCICLTALAGFLTSPTSKPNQNQNPSPPSATTADPSSLANVLQPAYVGNQACAACHPDHVNSHARSGHSRTFHADNLAEYLKPLVEASKSFTDLERDGTIHWKVDGQQLIAIYHDGKEKQLPVQFALGSGTHATTFLTLLDSDQGVPLGLEHRLSLFDGNRKLGVTPNQTGRPIETPIDCFGKLERGQDLIRCIECHSTTGHVAGRTVQDLRPNVGCESCHGPGREHAAAMQSQTDVDSSLRFTGRKTTPLEEIQLCGNCHRSPESLSAPPSRNDFKLARFQPVGLLNSMCYRRAEERLRCSTCHNPHDTVDKSIDHYVDKCRSCHSDVSKGDHICPKSAETGCIDCHMPAIEVHPGISFHDHWIRVREPKRDPQGATSP